MIVRDPVARFRSEYLWRNRETKVDVSAAAVEKWAKESFDRFDKDSYLFDNHLRPQADFYVGGAQVYRFEDGLDTVVADLNARFDLGLIPVLPAVRDAKVHTGFSSRDVQVSPRLERDVKLFYRKDLATFGYGKTAPSLRASLADSELRKSVTSLSRRILHKRPQSVAMVARVRD
jgi:hypothetical protein